MRCPSCGAADSRVVDSRPAEQGGAIRRRRYCEECQTRFTTYERAEPLLMVTKRSGRTEPFDSRKVRVGLEAALADRPVAGSRIEDVVEAVESSARIRGPVVSSQVIGIMVLEQLRNLDEVAYLRFASVYKDFESAADFTEEVATLEQQ